MKNTNNQKLNISLFSLSALCGIFTGFAVFFFKFCAAYVIRFSKWAYWFAGENPTYIPLLFIGLSVVSVIIYFILKTEPQVKGGGIPTAVKFIREGKSFNVIKNIIFVPVSALFTFLSGVPLGNEGPSVQLGCAMGDGVSKISRKNNDINRQDIMTAGACAGFGVATGAPLSGILFSVEEIKGKFSYKRIIAVGISTIFATVTAKIFSLIFGTDYALFNITHKTVLPLKYIWIPLVVGALSGLCAILFFALCKLYDKWEQKGIGKIKLWIRIEIILIISGVLGLLYRMYIGTGHDIAHSLLEGENAGLLFLILVLMLRMIMLIIANKTGITGGLFVPTLAMGALIGAISAKVLVMSNVIPVEYTILVIVMGMTAFLGSRGKMPLVALCFSLEALCGVNNIVPLVLCVITAYLVSLAFDIKKNREEKQ